MISTGREEFKENKQEVRSGIKELDEFINAGMALVDALPGVWGKAILFKFKKDRANLREYSRFQTEKMGLTHVFLQQYINIISQIKNQTWWHEVRVYINDQLCRFAFDSPIELAWKSFSNAQEDNKKKWGNILLFLLLQYKAHLASEESQRYFTQEKREAKLAALENIVDHISKHHNQVEGCVELQTYQERIQKAAALKKECLTLLDVSEKKWRDYDIFPILRPGLLLIVNNMYAAMLQQANEYVVKNSLVKLFSDNAVQKQLQQVILHLRQNMEKIAEVMLWQEQLYQQCGAADLVVKLTTDLHKILSPYLKHKDYHCVKLDCRASQWSEADIDLKQLFSNYVENEEKQMSVLRYLEFSPEIHTLEAYSKYRCDFIQQNGTDKIKENLQAQLHERSFIKTAHIVSQIIYQYPDEQAVYKKVISNFLRDEYSLSMLCRDYIFRSENTVSPEELLSRFPSIRKKFDKDILSEVTLQICALRELYLNLNDAKAWNNILILTDKATQEDFAHFVTLLLKHIYELSTQNEPVKNFTEECQQLIKEYFQTNHCLNLTELQKTAEIKSSSSNKFLHPEMTVLYDLYRQLNSQSAWIAALDIKLISDRRSKNYLDLLGKLTRLIEDQELRVECCQLWNKCQKRYFEVVFQNTLRMTQYLAAKYDHLDDFNQFQQALLHEREIRREMSQAIKCKYRKA